MTFSDGMKLFKAKRYEDAANAFKEATEQNDQDHASWNGLGICLSKLGNYETAGICFDNALVIAPGKETYQKNRDKNAEKINKDEDLELDDDPGPIRHTPIGKAKQSSKPAVPTQYTSFQIAGGIVAVFFVLMFMLGCMSILGGGGKSSIPSSSTPLPSSSTSVLSENDNKFITSVILGNEYIVPLMDQVILDASNNDVAGLKITSKKAKDQIEEILPVISSIEVSPKLSSIKEPYIKALNDYAYAYGLIYEGCVEYERGNPALFNQKVTEATDAINKGTKGFNEASNYAKTLSNKR